LIFHFRMRWSRPNQLVVVQLSQLHLIPTEHSPFAFNLNWNLLNIRLHLQCQSIPYKHSYHLLAPMTSNLWPRQHVEVAGWTGKALLNVGVLLVLLLRLLCLLVFYYVLVYVWWTSAIDENILINSMEQKLVL
jgi:hypothetical protein